MSEFPPSGWSIEPLRNVAQVVSGGTPSRYVAEFWDEGTIPWVTPTDLTATVGRFLSETRELITERGLQSCSATLLPRGSLLMTSRATLGEIRIALSEVCTNQGFKSLVPINGTDGEFLFYQMLQNRERYRSLGIGSTFLEVNKRDTERFEISVAPREDQRRIAEILTTVDEAIEQAEALIAKTQQITSGLMHDLFTRGVTPDGHLRPPRSEAPQLYKESPLGWIPKEWEAPAVCECLIGIDAGHSPECPDTPARGDQWGVLKVGAVDPMGFRPEQNKTVLDVSLRNPSLLVRAGDLLLSRANTVELVGLVCSVDSTPINLMLSDKTLRLRTDSSLVHVRFLFWSLQQPTVRRQIENMATGTSGSMKNISQGSVKSIRFGRPDLEEQARLVERIDAVAVSSGALERDVAKLSGLKRGLMHDLLTGLVRVPPTDVREGVAHV